MCRATAVGDFGKNCTVFYTSDVAVSTLEESSLVSGAHAADVGEGILNKFNVMQRFAVMCRVMQK